VRAVELPAPEAPPRPHADIVGLDVLLVEDDPDSHEALAIAIESKGAQVRLAESVRQALDAYDVRAPDILVSDIGMPGEDGYSSSGTSASARTAGRDAPSPSP